MQCYDTFGRIDFFESWPKNERFQSKIIVCVGKLLKDQRQGNSDEMASSFAFQKEMHDCSKPKITKGAHAVVVDIKVLYNSISF